MGCEGDSISRRREEERERVIATQKPVKSGVDDECRPGPDNGFYLYLIMIDADRNAGGMQS
jgi:hypothetical protein